MGLRPDISTAGVRPPTGSPTAGRADCTDERQRARARDDRANWSGASTTSPPPDEYGAIHFHDDDLEDAGWEADATVELPADLEPGVYAARLTTQGATDDVPFIVTSPLRPSGAKVALLLPTLTYLAYGSEHEILSNPFSYRSFTGRDASEAPLGWRDHLAVDLGLVSLYDVHRDGSSPVYASARRPLLNLRADYTWPLLEGPHGLAVDLALMAWLDERGIAFDLLCDHDLHAHGRAALDPYTRRPDRRPSRVLDRGDARRRPGLRRRRRPAHVPRWQRVLLGDVASTRSART